MPYLEEVVLVIWLQFHVVCLHICVSCADVCSRQLLTHLPYNTDRLFSYAWWAVWYNFLLLIILAIMLIANSVYLFRGGLIALVAINIMLMIETANSFLYYNNVTTLSGSFSDRARVTVAGAIIKAIASFLLIAVLGFKDEYGQWEEGTATPPPAGKTVGPTITKTTGPSAAAHCPPGTVPVSTVAAEQRV